MVRELNYQELVWIFLACLRYGYFTMNGKMQAIVRLNVLYLTMTMCKNATL